MLSRLRKKGAFCGGLLRPPPLRGRGFPTDDRSLPDWETPSLLKRRATATDRCCVEASGYRWIHCRLASRRQLFAGVRPSNPPSSALSVCSGFGRQARSAPKGDECETEGSNEGSNFGDCRRIAFPGRFPLAAPNRSSGRHLTLLVHRYGFFSGLHAKYTRGKVYLDANLELLVGLSDIRGRGSQLRAPVQVSQVRAALAALPENVSSRIATVEECRQCRNL